MTSRLLIKFSLIYFLIAGVFGVLLRLVFFNPIPGLNYKYILHAHSHIVLLGWVTNALFAALYFIFFESKGFQNRKWLLVFGLLQIGVVGMLCTFPIQGYSLYSIFFSTLHILISYLFCFSVLRVIKKEKGVWRKFVSWGVIYFLISSLGPFSLGPIMSQGLSGSIWYYLAIYFYLHFLYNGFFTFTIFGLFFWWLDKKEISYSTTKAKLLIKWMNIACFLSYSLSTLWTKPEWQVFVLAGVSAITLLITLIILTKVFFPVRSEVLVYIKGTCRTLLLMALFSFILKTVLQILSAHPIIANLAYEVRNFTIGYLHLVFIGFVTFFLIGWFLSNRLIQIDKIKQIGIVLLILGFISSEIIIISQPWVYITYYYQWLFTVSTIMMVGIILLLNPFSRYNSSKASL